MDWKTCSCRNSCFTPHPPPTHILTQAASGDIFIVGLEDVQSMLHKRRLGPKGMKIFKKFETQTGSWDLGLVRTGSVWLENVVWNWVKRAGMTAGSWA